jgi:hypothetical protein
MSQHPYYMTAGGYYPTYQGMRAPTQQLGPANLPSTVPLSEANRNIHMQYLIQEMQKVTIQSVEQPSTAKPVSGFDHLSREKELHAQRQAQNSKIDQRLGNFMTNLK